MGLSRLIYRLKYGKGVFWFIIANDSPLPLTEETKQGVHVLPVFLARPDAEEYIVHRDVSDIAHAEGPLPLEPTKALVEYTLENTPAEYYTVNPAGYEGAEMRIAHLSLLPQVTAGILSGKGPE